ncbi:hypothetical protein [Halococcus salifodinae]|nr:hypothetical protein [Halococcus salifodinae]
MNARRLVRYAVDELATHYDDGQWWKDRLVQRIVRPFQTRVHPGDGGIGVMDEEWDTLVVLDACRADLFETVADADAFDDYRRVTSRGSMTAEWVRRNFADESFGDTVYVSANPHVSLAAGDSFHELVEVWRTAFDEDEQTVLPEAVVDATLAAHERHPDKRLICHFMQPHYPFVGYERRFTGWHPDRIAGPERRSPDAEDPWQAIERGTADRDEVWAAYAENLELVLEHTADLAAELDGRTVLTTDHGNAIGERAWPLPLRLYGHPEGLRLPALVRVPWATIDGERRTVVDEGTHSVSAAEGDDVERRLRALGYR